MGRGHTNGCRPYKRTDAEHTDKRKMIRDQHKWTETIRMYRDKKKKNEVSKQTKKFFLSGLHEKWTEIIHVDNTTGQIMHIQGPQKLIETNTNRQ